MSSGIKAVILRPDTFWANRPHAIAVADGSVGLTRRPRAPREAVALAMFAALFSARPANGAEVAETEPNDSAVQAKVLAPGQFGRGVITIIAGIPSINNPDWWRSPAAVGNLVFAYADSQESTDFKDAVLALLHNDGQNLLEVDYGDGPPASFSSGAVVAGAVISQAGNVYSVVNGRVTSNTVSISPYRLYQAVVNPADKAAEQEGNNTVAMANSITARMMTGAVSGADVDFFKVYSAAGLRLVVIMDDNPDDNATYTDTALSILASDGTTTLATGDNAGSGGFVEVGDANAAGAIVVQSAGIHYIRVAHGGEAGALDSDYRFVVLVDGATAPLDRDTDGVADSTDNCPNSANSDQVDADGDGKGDPCDNCAAVFNADQADADADGVGDACEAAPPPDAACGACAQGVLPGTLLSLSLMMWGRRRRWRRISSPRK